jgi:hypothetical protein
MLQRNQGTLFDAFMLATGNLEEASALNPSIDPTHLRNSIYGLNGLGVQEEIYSVSWNLPFDAKLHMEIAFHNKYYGLRSPVITLNNPAELSNVLVKGFDFRINDVSATTNKNFSISAVRPSRAILDFGEVMIPRTDIEVGDSLAVHFDALELTTLPATLPRYKEAPPVEGLKCKAPDVFYETVWPLYSQLNFMQRKDYNDFAAAGNFSVSVTTTGDSRVIGSPQTYVCKTCHNSTHPYFPIPDDPIEACNAALARTNLTNPPLSFSLRGARGQFSHIPLYALFNPFDASKELQYATTPVGKAIFGPMHGVFSTYSKSSVDTLIANAETVEQRRAYFSALRLPARITWKMNPLSGAPVDEQGNDIVGPGKIPPTIDIDPNHELFGDGDFSTMKRTATGANILTQSDAVINTFVEKFLLWVEAENGAPPVYADIQPIISNKCVSCHTGNPRVNLQTKDALKLNIEAVILEIRAGRMPTGGGTLTLQERGLIEAWYAHGME